MLKRMACCPQHEDVVDSCLWMVHNWNTPRGMPSYYVQRKQSSAMLLDERHLCYSITCYSIT